MASFEPFAVDISIPAESGGNVMFHVRADNSVTFFKRVQEITDRVPSVRAALATIDPPITQQVAQNRIDPAGDLERQRKLAAGRAAIAGVVDRARENGRVIEQPQPSEPSPAGEQPHQGGELPRCPEHGKASSSRFFTGFYCPANGNGRNGKCTWKHQCHQQSPDCTHTPALKAAA